MFAKKAGSGAGRLGDGEAVFEHLKADNFTIGDGEDDREVCVDDFGGALDFGHEGAKYHGSIVVGEDVADLEADPLEHGARVIDEIGDGGPA